MDTLQILRQWSAYRHPAILSLLLLLCPPIGSAEASNQCCLGQATAVDRVSAYCDNSCVSPLRCDYDVITYSYSFASGCVSCESVNLPDILVPCGTSMPSEQSFAENVICDPGCECISEGQLEGSSGPPIACDNTVCGNCT